MLVPSRALRLACVLGHGLLLAMAHRLARNTLEFVRRCACGDLISVLGRGRGCLVLWPKIQLIMRGKQVVRHVIVARHLHRYDLLRFIATANDLYLASFVD